MVKQRFYLDTSVWYGIGAKEFKFDTGVLFNMILKKRIVSLYSKYVTEELEGASSEVRAFFRVWPSELKAKVNITSDIFKLADTYMSEGVVGNASSNDCIHIAAATIRKANILVSWNFKHIVNVKKIKCYNDINMDFGYPTLKIRSPREVTYYEED
jgi:predicted nucleic acid-binding protein